mgnify:FL=1
MNLTKLAKKIVQDNRDKKKNTDSSAEFHQNQLESICVFYLLASFCPASLGLFDKVSYGIVQGEDFVEDTLGQLSLLFLGQVLGVDTVA